MTKKKIALALSASTLIVLTGCASEKDASKDNFENVINDYFDRHCLLLSAIGTNYPREFSVSYEKQVKSGKIRLDENEKEHAVLAEVGLLNVEEGEKMGQISVWSRKKEKLITRTYSISELGKKYYQERTRPLFGKSKGFCALTSKVDEIQSFSEPSDFMGYRMSQVKYKTSPKSIESWADNDSVKQAFPSLRHALEKNKEKTTALLLMADGWVHEKDSNAPIK